MRIAAKKGQDEANLISAQKDLTRARMLVIRSFETQLVHFRAPLCVRRLAVAGCRFSFAIP
jgi:hypothetical protein